MQMSQAVVFALMEGKECDPFVYSQICARVCSQRQIRYDTCKANEIPPFAGGKQALLRYHDYLRRRKAMRSNLGGKQTIVVFFLDKDVDDFTRRCRKSPYTVYTRYYDIQNEIFLNGNLVQGSAAAASIDPALLRRHFSDARTWCSQAAGRWREWVALCIVSAIKCINHQCNYGAKSQVQNPLTGLPDATRLSQALSGMAAKAGATSPAFSRYHQRIRKRVMELYSSGQQDKVFKGKWYATLIDEDVQRLMGPADYDRQAFSSRVTSSVAATLNFADPWADYYTGRLAGVIDNP
jgi:hypothetical protein